MGAWGEGLFENDDHLDRAIELSSDAGVELDMIGYKAGEGDEGEYPCLGVDGTRQHLDDRTFERVWNKHKGKKGSHRRLLIFVALSMRVGATITEDKMKYLKKTYRLAGLWSKSVKQFRDALDGYKNGVPWDFQSKDLIEAAHDLREEMSQV